MSQPQTKQFPGYGIVSPDGVTGIKVVRTFTDGPSKTINPDGSVSYSTPPPTIHELLGGGFCYADGKPATNREHLELISDIKMRERAIQWYETHGKAITPSDIVVKEEGEKERPEPAYILSNQIPQEQDEVTKDLDNQMQNSLVSIAKSISSLTTLVMKQGEDIEKLKVSPPPKVKRTRKDQAERMKARWANPEYKAKMIEKIKKGREHGEVKEEV